eukprot:1162011-Pelagomonas_calceolata.AAC.3
MQSQCTRVPPQIDRGSQSHTVAWQAKQLFKQLEFKQLGLDQQHALELARNLHAHPVKYAHKLVAIRLCYREQ